MIILSILIPSLESRRGSLRTLLSLIGTREGVEVLTHIDDGRISTGNKRNQLVEKAQGKYVVHIDDDDYITPKYIPEILKAAEQDPDVICFKGWMTVDGANRKDFHFSINYPYAQVEHKGKQIYLRYPNHLCPIRRTIAKTVLFPNRTIGEDYEWATKLHEQKLLKTQVLIDEFIYHYRYNSFK